MSKFHRSHSRHLRKSVLEMFFQHQRSEWSLLSWTWTGSGLWLGEKWWNVLIQVSNSAMKVLRVLTWYFCFRGGDSHEQRTAVSWIAPLRWRHPSLWECQLRRLNIALQLRVKLAATWFNQEWPCREGSWFLRDPLQQMVVSFIPILVFFGFEICMFHLNIWRKSQVLPIVQRRWTSEAPPKAHGN